MKFIKPIRLKQGDTVAVVSPSWGGPSVFPAIYESGIRALNELGLKVKEYPTARAKADYLHSHPEARAKDINDAFGDLEVKAIFASIGGDDSIRILPYLNPEIIKKNPKILIGYSDTTTLLTYCNQLGIVTFHGPAIMAGFSQWNSAPRKFKEHVKKMLFEPQQSYEYQHYDSFSEKYPDWSNPKNVGKLGKMKKASDWKWLQGEDIVRGRLFGGCVEVMEFMKGTQFWPSMDFWKNKILFLETSENKPTPDQVKYMLRNYGMQGVYDNISALMIGRARDYSDKEKETLYKHAREIIGEEFKHPNLPIVANMDFGHTDPQFILPLGVEAEVDCKRRTFRLTESPLK